MPLIGDCTDAGEGGGGNVVVVGVKFDTQSREFLTWALVKVARPGDRVIALHVLDSASESTASLLSLVKSFDAMLGVYEGFCNLKQVDLKLKVCRGTSVKKILVREAKASDAATIVVGTSRTRHRIRSSTSVAKFCARKLPKQFSIFAVDNGKIVFQREATLRKIDCPQDTSNKTLISLARAKSVKASKSAGEVNLGSTDCSKITSLECGAKKNCGARTQSSVLQDTFNNELWKELNEEYVDNSLALVPVETREVDLDSSSIVVMQLPTSKSRWPFIRRVFLPKPRKWEKSSAKKMSVVQWGIKKETNAFGWPERYKVAIGVAEALDYLHNGCGQSVIHRDVKSSNILLSDDFEPQLSDFGLASWASHSSSSITCNDVAGTFGYLAPEYFMHGKVSDKIDVYAFGVVLLELLSGRKPINNDNPKGQESLVMWAKPLLKNGKVSQLLDLSLGSGYNNEQIERMVLAATLCISRSPRLRPQINIVLKLLQGDLEVTKWARQQVSASDELDNTDEEAVPSNIQSHLNLALLDLEDDSLSISSSPEQSISIEDYLQGRGAAHQALTKDHLWLTSALTKYQRLPTSEAIGVHLFGK
ncbi:LOW QUALITY PROTEIN: probable receptor-like serine/threonine-protein kinase At5g57670 [Carica papaya]|uniref:LOW QUALITY PROTEIN: probable receptor-like serine/threonine-protein kinase At5g57670 n=1 Tax=Carica papaya TaxID=3649 RepID=UPI000B8CF720|nr:LOW QUALITY PROTEIN: probable receptor-like serine/threonine-protein kinase At5g57670 [Carica papaya]